MKYYKMLYDYENDRDYVYCNSIEDFEGDKYAVIKGKLIQDWRSVRLKYNFKDGTVITDYVANLYRWLLFSDKICEIIERELNAQIQYLPVELVNENYNTVSHEFKVVNLLDTVDALDLSHSKYNFFEVDNEKILYVQKYALKKDVVDGYDMFRLKNDTISVFVSEKFKKIIEEKKMKGFDFLEVPIY